MRVGKSVILSLCGALATAAAAMAQGQLPELDLDAPRAGATQTAITARGGALRGVIQARDQAVIAASFSARVADLPRREGQSFAKGDVLVAFDCAELRAEIAGAQAEAGAARAEHDSNRELLTYKAVGALEVQQTKARLAQAEARVAGLTARSRDCQITAPFAGRVIETMINAHETPSPNQPLVSIINDGALELHVIAPSDWLVWLAPGAVFQFAIDETGETHSARVDRIGAVVDAVSQTVKVIGVFDQRPPSALAGMSGQAEFPEPQG